MDRGLADERLSYDTAGIGDDVPADPHALFRSWLDAARADDRIDEPTAMTLSTVAVVAGVPRPRARVVLCKDVDDTGLTFYTNRSSDKGREIAAQPWVALTFWWQPQYRAVRIEGRAEPVDDATSDAYFAVRPRGSQIGAHVSQQSRPVADRATLERVDAEMTARFADGEVPRPAHWGGYLVRPDVVEFWQGQPNRLHDRFRYTRHDGGWTHTRLQP